MFWQKKFKNIDIVGVKIEKIRIFRWKIYSVGFSFCSVLIWRHNLRIALCI